MIENELIMGFCIKCYMQVISSNKSLAVKLRKDSFYAIENPTLREEILYRYLAIKTHRM